MNTSGELLFDIARLLVPLGAWPHLPAGQSAVHDVDTWPGAPYLPCVLSITQHVPQSL